MEERGALEKIALITASPVRVAIVSKLNREGLMSYRKLKSSVEKSLERDVSDGSFAWHLEKLKGAGVITKTEALSFKETELSFEETDQQTPPKKFPKKVYKELKIGPYRLEGYLLTKEGSEIKDAVRVAIAKLKPP